MKHQVSQDILPHGNTTAIIAFMIAFKRLELSLRRENVVFI